MHKLSGGVPGRGMRIRGVPTRETNFTIMRDWSRRANEARAAREKLKKIIEGFVLDVWGGRGVPCPGCCACDDGGALPGLQGGWIQPRFQPLAAPPGTRTPTRGNGRWNF